MGIIFKSGYMSHSLWPQGLCVACQAPLSMELSRQESCSGCHFFSRGSSQPRDQTWTPALQADSLSSEALAIYIIHFMNLVLYMNDSCMSYSHY